MLVKGGGLGRGVREGEPQNLITVFENSVIRPVFHLFIFYNSFLRRQMLISFVDKKANLYD